MKRKTYKIVPALLAFLLLLGLLAGCSQEESLETSGEIETDGEASLDYIPYESEELGLLLKLPLDWDEEDYEITYDKKNDGLIIATSYGGVLVDIRRQAGELVNSIDDITMANAGLLDSSSGWTYYWVRPGDVQWSNAEEEAVYTPLHEDLEEVLNRIHFLETNPPKAENEGFKVVGSGYFTTEIPEEWDLAGADEDYRWNMLDERGDTIGYFQQMPYAAGFDDYSKTEVDGKSAWVCYIPDDTVKRTMELILFLKQNPEGIGLTIRDTLEFTGGVENYIDVESSSVEYRAGGAETLMAKILSAEENEDGGAVLAIEEVDETLTPTGYRMRVTVNNGTTIVPELSEDTEIISGHTFYDDYKKKAYNGMFFEITHYEGEAKTMFGVSAK